MLFRHRNRPGRRPLPIPQDLYGGLECCFQERTGPVEKAWPWQGRIDISFLNICGTFSSLCSIIDGYSRYIVHWEIRETMKERETEIIVQHATEKFPGENPRITT